MGEKPMSELRERIEEDDDSSKHEDDWYPQPKAEPIRCNCMTPVVEDALLTKFYKKNKFNAP